MMEYIVCYINTVTCWKTVIEKRREIVINTCVHTYFFFFSLRTNTSAGIYSD